MLSAAPEKMLGSLRNAFPGAKSKHARSGFYESSKYVLPDVIRSVPTSTAHRSIFWMTYRRFHATAANASARVKYTLYYTSSSPSLVREGAGG